MSELDMFDLYQKAVEYKVRFELPGTGVITTEDLRQCSKTQLETMYSSYMKLKTEATTFVLGKQKSTENFMLELQIALIEDAYDILERKIEAKKNAQVQATLKDERRQMLLSIKADKERGQYSEMTLTDIEQELAKLA